jgi:hypothetical protein
MNNEKHGNYDEDLHVSMRCYDALPPELREMLRNAFFQWATGPILKDLRKGRRDGRASEEGWLEHLIRKDARAVAADARKDWKAQAAAYLACQKPRRRRDWLDKPPRSPL